MTINCVWEHNGRDTLLYAVDFVGAYTRGESLEIAKAKMPQEIVSYCNWLGMEAEGKAEIVIVGEKCSRYECKSDNHREPVNSHVPLSNSAPFLEAILGL